MLFNSFKAVGAVYQPTPSPSLKKGKIFDGIDGFIEKWDK